MNFARKNVTDLADESIAKYPWSEHRELMSFCISSESFSDCEEENRGIYPDFEEVIAVVDKDWLYEYMEKIGDVSTDNSSHTYLCEEYTSDDSKIWFDEAIRTGHLAMVAFN